MSGLASRARGTLGAVIIIVGLILCVPGILGLVAADRIYGEPIYTSPQTSLSTTENGVVSLNIDDVCKAGKNYDFKVKFSIDVDNDTILGEYGVNTEVSSDSSDITETNFQVSSQSVNRSTSASKKLEYTENFEADTNVVFEFNTTQSENLNYIKVTIEVYENPNRVMYKIVTTASLIIMIPGAIVLLLGCCIAGKQKK